MPILEILKIICLYMIFDQTPAVFHALFFKGVRVVTKIDSALFAIGWTGFIYLQFLIPGGA